MLPLKRKQQSDDEKKTKMIKLYDESSCITDDSAPALRQDRNLFSCFSNMKLFATDLNTKIPILFEFVSKKANKVILDFLKNEECNILNCMVLKNLPPDSTGTISYTEILQNFFNFSISIKDFQNDISRTKIFQINRKLQEDTKLMNKNYDIRCKNEKLFFNLPTHFQNCRKIEMKTKYRDNFVNFSENKDSFRQIDFDSNSTFFSSMLNNFLLNKREKNVLLINNFDKIVVYICSLLSEEINLLNKNVIVNANTNEQYSLYKVMKQICPNMSEKDGIFFTIRFDNIQYQNFILVWMFKILMGNLDNTLEDHKTYNDEVTSNSLKIHFTNDAFKYLHFLIESQLSNEYDQYYKNIFHEKISKFLFNLAGINLPTKFIIEKRCDIKKRDLSPRNWFSDCGKNMNHIEIAIKVNFNTCSDLQNSFTQLFSENPIGSSKYITKTDLNACEKKDLLNSMNKLSPCSNASEQKIGCTTIKNKPIINMNKIRNLLTNMQTISIGTYIEMTSYFSRAAYDNMDKGTVHQKFKNEIRNNINKFESETLKTKYCSSVVENYGILNTEIIQGSKDNHNFLAQKIQNLNTKQHYNKSFLKASNIDIEENEDFEKKFLEKRYLFSNINKNFTSFQTASGTEILQGSQVKADGPKKSESLKFEFSNNQMISLEDITFDFNKVNSFNPKLKFLTTDFDFSKDNKIISKSLSSCALSELPSSRNKETCGKVSNATDSKKTNAASQTEILAEIFENYSDLSDLILKLKSCDSKSSTEGEDEVAISNVNHSLAHMRGSELENEFIQLKEKKLFVSTESTNLSRELTSFKGEADGEFSNSKGDFFSAVPEETNLYPIAADDESFYLNNEETVNTDGRTSKMENGNKYGIQRSKVRMGLSRRQKVKPLHPYFNYKEASG